MKRISDLNILNLETIPKMLGTAKSIAIIGSGLVEGDSLKSIKSADKVIRFNDFNRRSNFNAEMTTHRCDILFTHFDIWPITKENFADSIRDVVISIPFPFNYERIINRVEDTCLNKRIYTVNPYLQGQLCKTLGYNSDGYKHPSPTVGMTCLYHLLEIFNRIKNAPNLYITGFDWHVDFQSNKIDGRPINIEKMPGHWNHYYALEGDWASKNLLNKNNIQLSNRSKKALEIIKLLREGL